MAYRECLWCGKQFVPGGRGARAWYCCPRCWEEAKRMRASLGFSRTDGMEEQKHCCVDCGEPTPDHRCPACLKKWRERNGVKPQDLESV